MRARERRSLYRSAFSGLWSASPGATALFVLALVVVPLCGVAVVVAIGTLIGELPPAIAAGSGSSAAGRARVALGIAAVALVGQHAALSVAQALAATLGRRLEGALRHQVMAAALAPDDVGHLSDVHVLDRIAEATPLGAARGGPGWAVESMVPMLTSLLTGVAMAVLVSTHVWWLGLTLLAGWYVARHHRLRDNVVQSALIGTEAFGTRRQSYFRRLGLTPEAAKELRIFGLGGWLVERFHAQWSDAVEQVWAERRARRPRLLPPFLVLVVVNVTAFVFLGEAAARGDLDLRTLSILLQGAFAIAAMAEPGGTILADSSFVVGLSTMHAAADLEEALGTRAAPHDDERPLAVHREIRLDGVSFRYPGATRDVLHGLDLTIPAGRSLAVVGVNGAGKTTLVRLLGRLLEPTAGTVSVDGEALGDVPLERWRATLGVVLQDFTRFPLSAAENVTPRSGGQLDRERLDVLAERAGLADVVAALPRGWDTVLTRDVTGGVDLSGGQWQRVALARALAAVHAGHPVLLLDEPTASLDIRAEAAFYDRFLEITRGATTLVISHRFATVRRADAIAVLDGGRITEHGTHAALMAAGGTYARLFTLQARSFDDDGSTP